MVKLINCDIPEFNNRIKDKRLVCFGAGAMLDIFFNGHEDFNFQEKTVFIVDNNKKISGTFRCLNGIDVPVISYGQFLKSDLKDIAVLITSIWYFDEMLAQLDNEEAFNGMDCYIGFLLDYYHDKSEKFEFTKGEHPKIPKKIHYCWFGGAPIPEHLRKFMESWEKFCPDYEIIRWDESNYDITKNLYMKQAYEAKKWAFASDYARIDIIYNYGGIYLDTDVEVLKPFDALLYDDMFCGFEATNRINFGHGFGAVKRHPIIKDMAEQYEGLSFINQDGSLNLTPCPVYQSMIMKEYGFKLNGNYQIINGVAVYPTEVLCPRLLYRGKVYCTENTYSIHHFDGSWIDENIKKNQSEKEKKIREFINKQKIRRDD